MSNTLKLKVGQKFTIDYTGIGCDELCEVLEVTENGYQVKTHNRTEEDPAHIQFVLQSIIDEEYFIHEDLTFHPDGHLFPQEK